jgi:hypothetical protein
MGYLRIGIHGLYFSIFGVTTAQAGQLSVRKGMPVSVIAITPSLFSLIGHASLQIFYGLYTVVHSYSHYFMPVCCHSQFLNKGNNSTLYGYNLKN